MSSKWILTVLLLPLLVVSTNAFAGSTISDRSYWPNSARAQTATHDDVASAFASAGTWPREDNVQVQGGEMSPRYQGGPKSDLPRGE